MVVLILVGVFVVGLVVVVVPDVLIRVIAVDIVVLQKPLKFSQNWVSNSLH